MRSNLDAVFLPTVSRLAATSKDPEKLFLKKLAACWTVRGVCEKYLEKQIREDLVLRILEKKLALVSEAKTADEVDQILRQPRPQYNYGIWEENPLCIPGGRAGLVVHRLCQQCTATGGTGAVPKAVCSGGGEGGDSDP